MPNNTGGPDFSLFQGVLILEFGLTITAIFIVVLMIAIILKDRQFHPNLTVIVMNMCLVFLVVSIARLLGIIDVSFDPIRGI